MATLRKLQTEIDKTLKKVVEGLEAFDELWDQLYSTDNANQREKLEGNLKTEIKKLQRFRDQIKSWLSNAEIKDKTNLTDARKDIERRMERFKVCEKEAKTKAFSKEGLGAAARMDPREKARAEMRDWLSTTVDTMNTEIEEFEAEVEELSGQTGKKKGKPPPRLSALEDFIERHKLHITRLEQLLRLLDNDEITADDVEALKDLVDDYLERHQDDPDEFIDPDDIYADLLDQLNSMTDRSVAAAPANHTKADKEAKAERDKEEKERERQKAAAAAARAQLAAQGNTRLASETDILDDKKPSIPAAPVAAVPTPKTPTPATLPPPPPPPPAAAQPPPPPPPPGRQPPSPATATGRQISDDLGPAAVISSPRPMINGFASAVMQPSPKTPSAPLEAFPALGASNGPSDGAGEPLVPSPQMTAAEIAAQDALPPVDTGLDQLASQLSAMGLIDAPTTLTPAQSLQLLQASAPRSIPQPADAVWQPLPLRPTPPTVPPPPSYPTLRPPTFDNPALFDKLDPETLFFAFYHQPGTHQQFLAAKTLKQQAWRFHKQHQAWFQRHEEPVAGGQPGDGWEKGTYVYFDHRLHEGEGFVYRLKSDFLFQYDALEDELV